MREGLFLSIFDFGGLPLKIYWIQSLGNFRLYMISYLRSHSQYICLRIKSRNLHKLKSFSPTFYKFFHILNLKWKFISDQWYTNLTVDWLVCSGSESFKKGDIDISWWDPVTFPFRLNPNSGQTDERTDRNADNWVGWPS